MQGIAVRRHRDAAARDDQVVVRDDPVFTSRQDLQAARPVQGQIVPRKQRAVHPGCQDLVPEASCLKPVDRPLGEGQEDLFRLLHPDAGIVTAADIRPTQPDPHLGFAVCIHHQASILQGPGDHVAPRTGDEHGLAVYKRTAAPDSSLGAIQQNPCRAFASPASVPVVCRKPGRLGILPGLYLGRRLQAQRPAVHEQDREGQRADQNNDADRVNMAMCGHVPLPLSSYSPRYS